MVGSTRELTDSNQDATDTYVYDAWGNPIAETGSTTSPYRYVGRLGYMTEPEVDGYYVRRRYLRPGTGRWLSRDPVYTAESYRYVSNRTVLYADPSGLWTPGCDPNKCTGIWTPWMPVRDLREETPGLCPNGRRGTWIRIGKRWTALSTIRLCRPIGWYEILGIAVCRQWGCRTVHVHRWYRNKWGKRQCIEDPVHREPPPDDDCDDECCHEVAARLLAGEIVGDLLVTVLAPYLKIPKWLHRLTMVAGHTLGEAEISRIATYCCCPAGSTDACSHGAAF